MTPPLRAVVTQVRSLPSAPALALAPRTAPVSGPLAVRVQPVEPAAPPELAGPANEMRRPAAPEPPATTVEPVTAELRRFHVTVTERFLGKLAAARAALSHSHPGASDDELLELGLDLLLERVAKRKGLVKKPLQTPRPTANRDHVPAHVKRAVWERDGGKCQWPIASGGICGSTARLQLDHILPLAAGGLSTVDNCRLACEVHNDLAARLFFGDEWMDRYTPGKRRGRLPAPRKHAPTG